MLLSIIVFFVLAWGFSFFVDLFLNWDSDLFEQIVMRIGIGTALIPITGVIFNVLHIPLDWKIFTAVAVILPLIAIYLKKSSFPAKIKELKRFSFTKITKKQIYCVLLLVMFFITAYMYIHGSFVSPYFEDGDPYVYAMDAKYIALEKTFSAPYHFTHFAEPYPQGYQIFMGVLHQTNNSIYWTFKFFTALMVSFSILFFYYFAKSFTKNEDIALISTFALFAIPCWVSHFIFSLNFNMALLPVFLYALSKIDDNKRWKYTSMILYASLLVNHVNTAVSITLFFIVYYLNKVFVEEKLNPEIIHAGFFGFLISLIFYIPSYFRHPDILSTDASGLGGAEYMIGLFSKIFSSPLFAGLFIFLMLAAVLIYIKRERLFHPVRKILQIQNIKYKIVLGLLAVIMLVLVLPSEKIISIKGSGTRAYVLKDFFIAQQGNLTNNPIGVGLVLMTFFCIGILLMILNYKKLFKKENFWLSTTLIWTIVSLIIIFGASLSIMYIPFRMWTFFGLFASLVIGFAVVSLLKGVKQRYIRILILAVFVLLVIPTSFSQKYWHNTAHWSEHQIMVPESQQLYIWMRDGGLPKDSMVTNLCHKEILVFGYDMLSKPWLSEELDSESREAYYIHALNKSLEDNYNFLKRNDFDYVTLGASCVAKFKADVELLNNRLQEMMNSTKFSLVKNTKTEFLFKVD